MPVRYPAEFISLRYLDHEKREAEVGLVRRLDDWPPEAQALIKESLLKRYFVHTISAIHSVKHFQGYLNFDVETDLGPLQFIMRCKATRRQDLAACAERCCSTRRKPLPDPRCNRPARPRQARCSSGFVYW